MSPSEAITTLKRAGMTEKAIGLEVGARQSTINRICGGSMRPNYELGKALVDLAAKKIAESQAQAGADGGREAA